MAPGPRNKTACIYMFDIRRVRDGDDDACTAIVCVIVNRTTMSRRGTTERHIRNSINERNFSFPRDTKQYTSDYNISYGYRARITRINSVADSARGGRACGAFYDTILL